MIWPIFSIGVQFLFIYLFIVFCIFTILKPLVVPFVGLQQQHSRGFLAINGQLNMRQTLITGLITLIAGFNYINYKY